MRESRVFVPSPRLQILIETQDSRGERVRVRGKNCWKVRAFHVYRKAQLRANFLPLNLERVYIDADRRRTADLLGCGIFRE